MGILMTLLNFSLVYYLWVFFFLWADPDDGADFNDWAKPEEGTDPDNGANPDDGANPDNGANPDDGTDSNDEVEPDGAGLGDGDPDFKTWRKESAVLHDQLELAKNTNKRF